MAVSDLPSTNTRVPFISTGTTPDLSDGESGAVFGTVVIHHSMASPRGKIHLHFVKNFISK